MPADSMTEQNFHEIQLSGKQLVFVFMSAVVVAVVIFLLGVSVGRGVRNAVPSGTDVSAAPATVPPGSATPSGAKQANPGDLTYHDVLQGKGPASGGGSAQPPAPAPPPEATPPPTVAAPQASVPATPAPAETKAGNSTKGAKSAPLPTAGTSWFVQLGAFGTKENAEKQVQSLKAKSFSAFVYTPVGPLTRFHVRLGPFTERSEAERMAARLAKEGFSPLIQSTR